MDHITITDLRKEIERKREQPLTDEQFDVLVAGFRTKAAKDRLYSRVAVYKAMQRGWMSAQMAHFFKRYAGC